MDSLFNVIGYSKGYGFDPTVVPAKSDHEWNAVKLDGKLCIIDTTWGAGNIEDGRFKESYNEYYLCTPPYQLIRNHYLDMDIIKDYHVR